MSNLMIKKDSICFRNILMAFVFLTMTVMVTTVKAEDLTVYAALTEPVDVHNVKADYRVGHIRLRDSDLSFIENGDVVGKGHSISFVINHDKKTDIDTREFLVLVKLPEGTFWIKDVQEMPNKSLPSPNMKVSGVILGGTLGYKGTGGTFDAQLSADGKAQVVVYHIARGK